MEPSSDAVCQAAKWLKSSGETVWKSSATSKSPHHQTDHRDVDERLLASTKPLVVHRLSLLFCPSQEKVLSTTHRRGRATYPRGGISLCQSIFLPSLAHSSAQTFATCSGTGLGGLRTTSTLRPISSSAHLLPLPSYPASSHRCLRRESPVRADSSRSLSPSWSGTFALCTLALSTNPSVSTSRCRFRPLIFLLPS